MDGYGGLPRLVQQGIGLTEIFKLYTIFVCYQFQHKIVAEIHRLNPSCLKTLCVYCLVCHLFVLCESPLPAVAEVEAVQLTPVSQLLWL